MSGNGHPKPRHAKALFVPVNVRTSNEAEIRVAQEMESQGWTLYKRGWPDFIAVRGEEVRFLEVKPIRESPLSAHQRTVAAILARFGIKVERVAPPGPPLLHAAVLARVNKGEIPDKLATYLNRKRGK